MKKVDLKAVVFTGKNKFSKVFISAVIIVKQPDFLRCTRKFVHAFHTGYGNI